MSLVVLSQLLKGWHSGGGGGSGCTLSRKKVKILSKERKRRIVVESDRRSRDVPLRHCGTSARTEWRIGR